MKTDHPRRAMQKRHIFIDEPLIPPYPGPYQIPILLDDIKQFENFEMTRWSFFNIEASNVMDDWVAILRKQREPFLLFGSMAVLHRPSNRSLLFDSPGKIDRLFDAIEAIEGLVVESSSLWLPNFLFGDSREWRMLEGESGESPASRGATWRISYGLFRWALQFKRELIDKESFLQECQTLKGSEQPPFEHSVIETRAFRDWSQNQFKVAKKNFEIQRADRRRGMLDYRDQHGRIITGMEQME